MRISDWSSDVCSSDLRPPAVDRRADAEHDLDAVYRTHRTSLFHFLRRKAGPAEAPDLGQEGFARAAGSEPSHRRVNPENGRAAWRDREVQTVDMTWVGVS